MTKMFFDTEFSGLHKDTTLISLGIIMEDNRTFYAEFNDYDKTQIDNWIEENVISNLIYNDFEFVELLKDSKTIKDYSIKGNKETIAKELKNFLSIYDFIEVWSDCLSYDWVLFNDLFNHAFNLPKNIHYIPFDICTLFKALNIDPDISREEFIDKKIHGVKHNSLYDAKVIKCCYEKLTDKTKSK